METRSPEAEAAHLLLLQVDRLNLENTRARYEQTFKLTREAEEQVSRFLMMLSAHPNIQTILPYIRLALALAYHRTRRRADIRVLIREALRTAQGAIAERLRFALVLVLCGEFTLNPRRCKGEWPEITRTPSGPRPAGHDQMGTLGAVG